MPQRQGKCINFGLCTMADSREAITLPEGEDFSCPECGKMLSEVEGKGGGPGAKGGGKSKLVLAVVAVALLAVGGYFLIGDKTSSDTAPVKTEPLPIAGGDKTQPDSGPVKEPVKEEPVKETPVQKEAPVQKEPPVRKEAPVRKPVEQIRKEPEEHTVAKRVEHTAVRTPAETERTEKVEPPYTGPTSGAIVWEGTAKKGELISIENGIADKGVIVSGKLPGVPVLIAPLNTKKVAIAGAPGPDSKYQRVVLRIQGNGQMKVELSWSVVP